MRSSYLLFTIVLVKWFYKINMVLTRLQIKDQELYWQKNR